MALTLQHSIVTQSARDWSTHRVDQKISLNRDTVRRCLRLPTDARKELRHQRAPAMLERVHRRPLEMEQGRVGSPTLPKSPLGEAIRYTLGRLQTLVRYQEDGRYKIDTKLVKNAICPTCIGKRNLLRISHSDAGWRNQRLQPVYNRPAVSDRSGRLVERCAASDPTFT